MTRRKLVGATCPICHLIVPMLTVTVKRNWWGKMNVTIDGEATDWVAHIWTHQEGQWVS